MLYKAMLVIIPVIIALIVIDVGLALRLDRQVIYAALWAVAGAGTAMTIERGRAHA